MHKPNTPAPALALALGVRQTFKVLAQGDGCAVLSRGQELVTLDGLPGGAV